MKPITAEVFLQKVWPFDLLRDESFELRVINREDKTIKREFLKSHKEFLEAARKYGPGYDIYFGISTRFRQGGKKKDCLRCCVVWVDFDKVKTLPDFGKIPPDMVVDSGNGFHVYWILENPIYVKDGRWKEIEAVNRALSKKFGGDPMCIDVSRILRVPGFDNHKYEPTRKVTARALHN